MKVKDEHSWSAFVAMNTPEYSFLANAAKEWADSMGKLIEEGKELTLEVAEKCFLELDENYTGYQHNILVVVIAEHWIHGELLKSIYKLT